MTGAQPADGWNPKTEAIRLWSADPCGAAAGSDSPGTREFYDAVERDRYAAYAPWLLPALRLERFRGRRMLEVGCGLGTDLLQFARAGAHVSAVDLTPRHLELARGRLMNDGYAARLVRSDAERLAFADGSLDVVYSFGVLHHTPNIREAIAEVHRVLKPGGTALVAVYHRQSLFYVAWMARALATGTLITRGYRRVMADIEQHPSTDAVPLVDVYSRREAHGLFSRFSRVTVSTHHAAYAAPVTHMARVFGLGGPSRERLERLLRRFGWYLVVEAEK